MDDIPNRTNVRAAAAVLRRTTATAGRRRSGHAYHTLAAQSRVAERDTTRYDQDDTAIRAVAPDAGTGTVPITGTTPAGDAARSRDHESKNARNYQYLSPSQRQGHLWRAATGIVGEGSHATDAVFLSTDTVQRQAGGLPVALAVAHWESRGR